jgi:hypothetical protein
VPANVTDGLVCYTGTPNAMPIGATASLAAYTPHNITDYINAKGAASQSSLVPGTILLPLDAGRSCSSCTSGGYLHGTCSNSGNDQTLRWLQMRPT